MPAKSQLPGLDFKLCNNFSVLLSICFGKKYTSLFFLFNYFIVAFEKHLEFRVYKPPAHTNLHEQPTNNSRTVIRFSLGSPSDLNHNLFLPVSKAPKT